MSRTEILFSIFFSLLLLWNIVISIRLNFCKTVCDILLSDSEDLQRKYFLETTTPHPPRIK